MTAIIITHALVALLAVGIVFAWVRVLDRALDEAHTDRAPVTRSPRMQDRKLTPRPAIGSAPLRAAS